MDTLIGTFKLTDNQIANLSTVSVAPFLGGSYKHDTGEYIAVSEKEPSNADITAIGLAISSLSDTPSQSVLEARFSTDLMLKTMAVTFTGVDAVSLAPYLSAIQNYADFKNFSGIKAFIGGLVALGKATQPQADSLYSIFSQQGIDLGSYV